MSAKTAVAEFKESVSRETLDLLERFEALLVQWNSRINLVSPTTISSIWTRHIVDSAQLLQVAPHSFERWVDLGSGGGFPGIVIAILTRDAPGSQVYLVESDQRKAAFLRAALRECGVTASVQARRIEEIPPLNADVISARALAPLVDLFRYAQPHLSPAGVGIFPKGAKADIEVAEAQKKWSFSHETFPSKTDPEASVLKIGDIKRV